MTARIGPWIAAAVMGAVALLVCLCLAEFVPVAYSASGRVRVPRAALRSLDEFWPDASRVNRWLAQPLPVRPIVEAKLTGDEEHPPQIVVAARGPDAEAVTISVNEVLDAAHFELRGEGLRFTDERHRALLTLLHHARAERARAQRQLDEHVAQRLKASPETPPATPVVMPPQPVVAPPVQAPIVERRNPLWDDLARHVGELEGRRAGLLLTMTPAHPVIRDLDWRLAQLRDQLHSSPEFTGGANQQIVNQLPPVIADTQPALPRVAPPVPAPAPSDGEALRELRKRVAAADRQLGIAVQQERDAWQELSALRTELQTCVTSAVIPTQPDESMGREQIRWGGALLALSLAGATFWRKQPRRKVLRSTEEVRRTLGVPVLGKFSTLGR
ncbi:MAG: hypothetical protein SGJ19_27780 [Planctomycetia bacterium]|nr:hypothetical protein [Planctomycetia bacterium]